VSDKYKYWSQGGSSVDSDCRSLGTLETAWI